MSDKLEQLQKLAYKISDEVMKLDIDPKRIAIRLPNDYWCGAISDKDFMYQATYHMESIRDHFELYGVTFYNDRSKPDWMKK